MDAETLLHHRLERDPAPAEDDADRRASQEFWSSVYRTGMLPTWVLDRRGDPVDTSGLGGFGEQATHRRVLHWDHANTDEMQLGQVTGQVVRALNVPVLRGVAQSPLDHQAALVRGFSDMYLFWHRHREALTAPEGPLHALGRQESRFIARDSRFYGELRYRLVQPAALASGVAQSLELEPLATAFVTQQERPEPWPLVAAEQKALLRHDIPYFSARADGTGIDVPGGGRLMAFFGQPSIARAAHPYHSRTATPDGEPDGDRTAPKCLGDADLLSAAQWIAERLAEDAIEVGGGGAAWIGLDYQHRLRRYQYQPIGHGLYSGRSGIGLFLAAMFSVTGEQRWRDLALRAVAGVRRRARRPPEWVHDCVVPRGDGTRRSRHDDIDQLCCGAFGRIELLLAAGTVLPTAGPRVRGPAVGRWADPPRPGS